MGFSVIPTNIGGVSLSSIAGPLASLMNGTPSAQNMLFPADLGSNPSMGHAVIFTVYDYKTGLTAATNTLGEEAGNLGQAAIVAFSPGATEAAQGAYNKLYDAGGNLINSGWNVAVAGVSAANYTPLTQGANLATISLFMPETMQINYSSTYEEVSLTQELGLPGMISNAYSDYGSHGLSSAGTPYAKAIGAAIGQDLATKAGLGSNLGGLAKQSMGIFTNPQLQLLYKGIGLREFSLSFTLTPKTKAEAETVKNICDSFAYYSLPGISGAQDGNSGMFLTPPQVFKIDFQFLGDSGLVGKVSNAIYSALNKTGLNVFGNSTTITGGKPSKTFNVNDCVLQGVSIDYAPNGWATYNDGYPVQTTILLNFKETTMYTKREFKNSTVASNYSNAQAQDESQRIERVYAPRDSAYNDAGY